MISMSNGLLFRLFIISVSRRARYYLIVIHITLFYRRYSPKFILHNTRDRLETFAKYLLGKDCLKYFEYKHNSNKVTFSSTSNPPFREQMLSSTVSLPSFISLALSRNKINNNHFNIKFYYCQF